MTPLIPFHFELKLSAASGGAVEGFTAAFSEVSGLEATMESSSAQGDKVRARLRVGERA